MVVERDHPVQPSDLVVPQLAIGDICNQREGEGERGGEGGEGRGGDGGEGRGGRGEERRGGEGRGGGSYVHVCTGVRIAAAKCLGSCAL